MERRPRMYLGVPATTTAGWIYLIALRIEPSN
jgi:hypothetical protein